MIPRDYEDNHAVRTYIASATTEDVLHPNYDTFREVVEACGVLASAEEAARDLAWDTWQRWDHDGRHQLDDDDLYEAYWQLADAIAVEQNPAPADALARRRELAHPPTVLQALAAVAQLAQLGRYYSKGRHHDRLAFALATRERLAASSDALLLDAVIEARRNGHTWDYIGDSLGLPRQNAYRRFAHRIPDNTTPDPD